MKTKIKVIDVCACSESLSYRAVLKRIIELANEDEIGALELIRKLAKTVLKKRRKNHIVDFSNEIVLDKWLFENRSITF